MRYNCIKPSNILDVSKNMGLSHPSETALFTLTARYYVFIFIWDYTLASHLPQKASTGLVPLNVDLPMSLATVCRMASSDAL